MRKRKLIKMSHHRNGICGVGFWVVIFNDYEDEKKKMLGIQFDDSKDIYTAVFDIDLLTQNIIEFGKNSWRGDHFTEDIQQWINEYNEKVRQRDKDSLEEAINENN